MSEASQMLDALLKNIKDSPLSGLVRGLSATGGENSALDILRRLTGTVDGVDSSIDDEEKALLCARAMIAAAKCDGHIDEDEKLNILNSLAEAGVSPSKRSWVEDEMRAPLDLAGLVAAIPDKQTASEVYTASLMAIKVDTAAEEAFVRDFAQRLGLSAAA